MSGKRHASNFLQMLKSNASAAHLSRNRGRIGNKIVRLVLMPHFDYLVCFLIMLNALSIGILTDYVAKNLATSIPTVFRVFETGFCLLFAVELVLRIYVYRCYFFVMPSRGWNFFDLAVVGLQVLEEVGNIVAPENKSAEDLGQFSFVRVLRIIRLIRVVRLIRLLRLITDLRTLVISILASMKALFWTVLLLFGVIYTLSLYLTQLVADHRSGKPCIFPATR